MAVLIRQYIQNIQSEFDTGQSTEHSFRSALKTLLESLDMSILALNESQRITGVGMPDFTIKDKKNNTINIGRIEAKDLYVDLSEEKNKDQLSRYLSAFDNFIYTNNLTFNFYRQGKLVDSVSLGTCDRKAIHRNTSDLFADNIVKLERLLKDFLAYSGQTITSPEKLARAMAQKAQLIKYAIENIFQEEGEQSGLYMQYQSFKDLLIHDLTAGQFADMYAQTIAYGLFTARLHDPNLPTFSREEAEKLIPKSTPFIRWLFKQVADDDVFDDRIAHVVDDLVGIFLHCDVAAILQNYGRSTKMQDPIIHFYETFLGEYDAKMRKARGVYYTPEPVVKFIVRGVDHLLKKEFGLTRGLADTSKIEKEFKTTVKDYKGNESINKEKKRVHRVQLLDPATGTGTFLNEVIRYIYSTYFSGQTGIWSSYVAADLLPRIRGFEILMASYTMAHLKLGLTLEETGRKGNDRINIYLTNSLEEPHDNLGTLFSQQLAKESEQASKVKKEQPIMVVIGNPPYAISSSNKGDFIQKLIVDYKKDLNERKINLDDDYIKFIRYAQYFIDNNKEGVIGFITNNSYIDGVTHRQMRKTLMESFDTIYVYDLHGNSKKKETHPDGSKDDNVFDIMQGVSIIFAIKTSSSKKPATVYQYDSYGKRDIKYEKLTTQTISDISWKKLTPVEPYYFFVPKDFSKKRKYDEGVKVDELFGTSVSGIESGKDKLVYNESLNNLLSIKEDFVYKTDEVLIEKYGMTYDKVMQVKNDISNAIVIDVSYKCFSNKKLLRSKNSGGVVRRSRNEGVKNYIDRNNLSMILMRAQVDVTEFKTIFVSRYPVDKNFFSFQTHFFPLYIYNEGLDGKLKKSVNMDMVIVQGICEKLELERDENKERDYSTSFGMTQKVGPEDIFDYIYAVLHSPVYRDKYKEFLKIDFPRIPFTDKQEIFWSLVEKGHTLRLYHLMEHPESENLITTYPIDGDNIVDKISSKSYVNNRVYINDTQYIDGVPAVAWNFYIGGYQPAQKRLKDRQGKKISYEDIIHYQKIIVALVNTDRVMGEIGKVRFL